MFPVQILISLNFHIFSYEYFLLSEIPGQKEIFYPIRVGPSDKRLSYYSPDLCYVYIHWYNSRTVVAAMNLLFSLSLVMLLMTQ